MLRYPHVLMWMVMASILCLSCGGDPTVGETEDENTLSLMIPGVPSKDLMDVDARARRAVFDRFLQTHPQIQVGWRREQLRAEGPMGESTELMTMAAEMGPDVLYADAKKIGTFKDQGFFYPLDEYLARYEEEYGEPFVGCNASDDVWNSARQDGRVWAIPYFVNTICIMYRRDIFRKAGLDPDRPPTSWDEFYAQARALTHLEKDGEETSRYGYVIRMGSGTGDWRFSVWVWSAGGEMVRPYKICPNDGTLVPVEVPYQDFREDHIRIRNEDEYYPRMRAARQREFYCPKDGYPMSKVKALHWQLALDEEPGIAAMTFYQKLAWSEWTRCTNPHAHREFDITEEMKRRGVAVCPICGRSSPIEDLRETGRLYVGVGKVGASMEDFVQGKIAMMMVSSGIGDLRRMVQHYDMDPDQVGLFSVPGRTPGMGVNMHDAGYLAINSGLKDDPRTRDAAWEYIQFMTSDEAYRTRTKVFVESGAATLIRPYWLERFGYGDYLREVPVHWAAADREIGRRTKSEPYVENWKHVETVELAIPIDRVLLEKADPEQAIRACVDRVNSMIMRVEKGKKPSEKVVGVALMVVFVAGMALVLFWVARMVFAGKEARPGEWRASDVRRQVKAWMFMLPGVLSVLIWAYVPLTRGSIMAFFDYRILGGSRFVGLDNFATILTQRSFYEVLSVTVYYAALSLGLGFFAPLILAVLLTEVPRFKVPLRTVYILPSLTTGLVILFLWKSLLYDPEPTGLLNQLLGTFGLPPQKWLQDSKLALCIVIPGIWGGMGMGSLIYLAALGSIPQEQYEAADIDGAGVWRKFWVVTFPYLRALVIINFVGAFIGSFRGMQNIFAMTGGGPGTATRTIGIDIWSNAFLYLKFGYATSMAWILGAFLIGFTVYQLGLLKRVRFTAPMKA